MSKDAPHLLKRQPFDPEQFLRKGWKTDEQIGRRTEDNLDAGRIVGKDYLHKGEFSINGEERIRRIKASSDIQMDASDFIALWQEEGHVTLKWLYETKGMTFLSFWATILRFPLGHRCVLYLLRNLDGSWRWDCHWVGHDLWLGGCPSSVLE